jgi:hypothetical protein
MDVCIALFFLVKSSFRRRVVVELLLQNVETKLEERNLESIRRDENNAHRVVIAVLVIFVIAFVSRACFVRCAIARVMLSMHLCVYTHAHKREK